MRGRKELIRLRRKLRINLKMTYPNKRRPRELRRDASHLSSIFFFQTHDIMHEREFLKEMSDPSLKRKQFTSFLSKQLVSRLLTAIR